MCIDILPNSSLIKEFSGSNISALKSLLSSSEVFQGHGQQFTTCKICSYRWLRSNEVLNGRTIENSSLGKIAALWHDEHEINITCHPCLECYLELAESGRIAVLAVSGVSTLLLWGPVHRGGEKFDNCKSCYKWVQEVGIASERLKKLGMRADRWLPDTNNIPHRTIINK
jgi:hypothetical protein